MSVKHKIDIQVLPSMKGRVTTSKVKAWAEALLEAHFNMEQELSIALVDDPTIQALNRDYRGKDTPTDVLSFSMREGKQIGQAHLLGDIVISIPTAVRQAKAHGHSLDKELLTLLIHGFCHLLGYDHQNSREEREMKKEEQRLFKLPFFNPSNAFSKAALGHIRKLHLSSRV